MSDVTRLRCALVDPVAHYEEREGNEEEHRGERPKQGSAAAHRPDRRRLAEEKAFEAGALRRHDGSLPRDAR